MDSDDEHAQIMARLAELEMAEEAAEDDDEDDDSEEIETDFRAVFRRSRLDESDDTEEEDDEDEEKDEDEDEDEDREEVDIDDRTAVNTFLNRSTVRLSEVEGQEFQSSILQSQHGNQVQARGPGTPSVGSAAGPSEQRRVKFSEVDDVAKPSSPEPLPPRDIKASAAQKRVWSFLTPKNGSPEQLIYLT